MTENCTQITWNKSWQFPHFTLNYSRKMLIMEGCTSKPHASNNIQHKCDKSANINTSRTCTLTFPTPWCQPSLLAQLVQHFENFHYWSHNTKCCGVVIVLYIQVKNNLFTHTLKRREEWQLLSGWHGSAAACIVYINRSYYVRNIMEQ